MKKFIPCTCKECLEFRERFAKVKRDEVQIKEPRLVRWGVFGGGQ